MKRVTAPKSVAPTDKPLVAARLPAYTPLTEGKSRVSSALYIVHVIHDNHYHV